MNPTKEKSLKKRTLYMFVSTSIVLVYLILYSFLSKPNIVNAQSSCFQVTIEECSSGPACIPECASGIYSDIVTIGRTAGPYGVPIRATLCFDNFN